MISERKLQANRANLLIGHERRKSRNTQVACQGCGDLFIVRPCEVATRKYCKWACRKAVMRGSRGANAGGGQQMIGPDNPNWKGGKSKTHPRERKAAEHSRWRRRVFERDHYTCLRCGHSKGHILAAHHIAPWAQAPDKRFHLENGATLCGPCHRWVHSKANMQKEWLVDA